MLRVFVFVFALLVSGCSSTPTWLENRIACTVDGKQAHAVSVWGLFSIGSRIAEADAAAVCKRVQT